MKTYFYLLLALGLCFNLHARAWQTTIWPDSICVGGQEMHVQGIALDTTRKCMYFSFTNRLLKTDLNGNILGSVDGLEGHLGAIALNPEDGCLYASLECKNDEIGRGIARKMGFDLPEGHNQSVFYIAIFDPDRIVRTGQTPQDSSVMKSVCVKEAVADFSAQVTHKGKKALHRYGCSGIDGIMFAPPVGEGTSASRLLYVGYGIYGDTTRTDNNHQVLLSYRPADLKHFARRMDWKKPHFSGPHKPLRKYFVYTGNTNYGIQNMTYDEGTGTAFLAVYRGKKKAFPNYPLFMLDMKAAPYRSRLNGVDEPQKKWIIPLCRKGSFDKGMYGWHFPWGSTGICAVGNGCFYISENGKDDKGKQYCKARLYRFVGKNGIAFRQIDE